MGKHHQVYESTVNDYANRYVYVFAGSTGTICTLYVPASCIFCTYVAYTLAQDDKRGECLMVDRHVCRLKGYQP